MRGGEEHRNLKLSQLKADTVDVDGSRRRCYVYTEHGSKNRSGGLGQLHLENKVVHHFEIPEAGERDYVRILYLYLSKLPKAAFEKDLFYVRPVSVCKPDQPWYTSVPVGKNKLSSMVKTMCSLAGIEGNKTNHSLRSFGVSSMFEQQIPEKIIQERSGHRSLDALRVYEKTTNQQKVEASRVMSMPSTSEASHVMSMPSTSEEQKKPMERSEEKPQVSSPDPQMFQGCSFSNCTFTFSN